MTYTEPALWPTGADPAPMLCGEEQRLTTLASYSIDRLNGDPELVQLAQFAAKLCGAPSAAVSIVEAKSQIFIAREGLTESQTPRSTSFCAHTMLRGEMLVVPDARNDPRFEAFSLVTGDANLRFYAGAPLISAEGAPLGALCVIDYKPRPEGLTDLQREGLAVLAEAVKRRLLSHREGTEAFQQLELSRARLQFLIDSVPDIAWSTKTDGTFDLFNARWEEWTAQPRPHTIEDWRSVAHPDDFERAVTQFNNAVRQSDDYEYEWRMKMADGSYRWMLTRAVPSSRDPNTARWFGTITDIDDRHRAAAERELLAGELAHRIKNTFSVIIGLITLHARGDEKLERFAGTMNDTIHALARAQDFALQTGTPEADDLKALLELLTRPYATRDTSAISIAGENVTVGARATTPLALAFHELATNSAKYGALSVPEGRVSITVLREDNMVRIKWHEQDGPPTAPPEEEGFGSRLVSMSISHQLAGTIEYDWQTDGLQVIVSAPATQLEN
ncbi:MAG: HWE histidine kinase domain-containing protein [Pseudomonadota bacterium]|nr:HWE histidine kinase domain-containing protein [Pseudomonadota bacterium]